MCNAFCAAIAARWKRRDGRLMTDDWKTDKGSLVIRTMTTELPGGDLEQYAALAERAVAALVPRWAPDRGPL